VHCSVALSLEELAKSISVDQSLSVGYGPLGSVSQKLNFIHKLQISTYSLTIAVYASKVIDRQSRVDVRFKPSITIPRNAEEVNEFVRYYGDAFVSNLSRGGEYIAAYTFYCRSHEEQTQLKAELRACGIYSGVSIGGDLQLKIESIIKKVNIAYALEQEVTGLLNPKLPDESKLVEYAIGFPSLALDKPVVTAFETSGYETVPGSGNAFAKVAANRTYLTGNTIVGGLTSKLTRIDQAYNQMLWLADLYNFYNHYLDTTLQANSATAKADIKAILEQMNSFGTGSNPTATFPTLDLKALTNGTPILQFQPHRSPVWGGNGGAPFNDVDINSYLQRKTRLQSVGLRSGSRIDQIRTTFVEVGSSKTTIATHGGSGGSDAGRLDLIPGQGITRISGRAGSRIDHLRTVPWCWGSKGAAARR
jgi:hypothetical protein